MNQQQIKRLEYLQQHHKMQKQMFLEASKNNVIIRNALHVGTVERLPEEWIWLEAALALADAYKQLLESSSTF